ncbi:hypothetical protein HW932_19470 [Allochromatium humboldtianum]|uniref:Uncharacterized protein n=1 Tax=Allochromatium humboldtianum TaxID=504901 RepID=A0A850REM2_9GAMM|nr:hypothetical protein [Allochromatium humboldtianum]NVZ11435.1 hypothetical protein [Allochromatium humboldtianum]
MRNNLMSNAIESQLDSIFRTQLHSFFQNCSRDQWKAIILNTLCNVGQQFGFQVFSSKNLCPQADCDAWIYDQHWRLVNQYNPLVRLPLVMQIETIQDENVLLQERITQSVLKLAQSRADVRLLVLECSNAEKTMHYIYNILEQFENSQAGDRYVFALWDFDIPWNSNSMQVLFHHK